MASAPGFLVTMIFFCPHGSLEWCHYFLDTSHLPKVAAKDLSSPDLEVLVTQEGEERCCIAREREGGSRNCITHPCSLQLPKKIEMTCVCADSF